MLNVGNANKNKPLTTNTTFAVSQLPALRAMLASLRPKLRSLPPTNMQIESDGKREERRWYIEERTKMQVDSFGGNTNVVKGRSVDAEDVEALEKVVAMLDRD